MKMSALAILLVALMAGCTGSPSDQNIDVAPIPDVVDSNTGFCDHKYSDERDFYYKGQVKSFTQELFGQSVTTFTFTLVDDTERFLSKDEFANYNCK